MRRLVGGSKDQIRNSETRRLVIIVYYLSHGKIVADHLDEAISHR